MVRVGNYIYEQAPTGDWVKTGKVIDGIDGEYIQYYI